MTQRSVLVVDGDRERRQVLQRSLAGRAQVQASADFPDARTRLLVSPPHVLVTNTRLGSYNGLHLAYLAATLVLPTRVLVYGIADDVALAREAQHAGAFYVPMQQIAAALPVYVAAELPPRDRRNVERPDRRREFRGGRRITDSRTLLAS
jgi:DNA-binding NtrC family response regulator